MAKATSKKHFFMIPNVVVVDEHNVKQMEWRSGLGTLNDPIKANGGDNIYHLTEPLAFILSINRIAYGAWFDDIFFIKLIGKNKIVIEGEFPSQINKEAYIRDIKASLVKYPQGWKIEQTYDVEQCRDFGCDALAPKDGTKAIDSNRVFKKMKYIDQNSPAWQMPYIIIRRIPNKR